MQSVDFAACRAREIDGMRIDTNNPMIEITTKTSIRVKPSLRFKLVNFNRRPLRQSPSRE